MSKNYAKQLVDQLDEFHTYNNPYDDPLDTWIHSSYAEVKSKPKNVDWTKLYFSPSSANACPRALYHKAKRHKKDVKKWLPHQRRWVSLGEGVGDMIQRELLLCDRHFEKFTKKKPKFSMGITPENYPAFEDFIFKQKVVEHDGVEFSLIGTSDGILVDNETGDSVILEVKSKQETPSKTSIRAMTSPTEDHTKQVVCYSIMYDVDDAIILYYNTAKKKWFMTDEDYANTPDLRAFDVRVTQEDRDEILDFFAYITKCVNEDSPPLPDLTKWLFNDYKDAIYKSITDEEINLLEALNELKKDSLPPYMQASMKSALEDIKRNKQ